jgi:uncharacterized damage-inducible protein DinB
LKQKSVRDAFFWYQLRKIPKWFRLIMLTTKRSAMVHSEISKAWAANTALNNELLAHLSPAMLEAVTPGGGYSVAQHLAHMTECIKSWGMELETGGLKDLPDLYSNYEPSTGMFDAETNFERIQSVMTQTRDAALQTAELATGTGNLPHGSVGGFLIHMLVHEAHHRGQILIALKAAGHTLPNEEAMWLPWRS